jgi:hypothetical protein
LYTRPSVKEYMENNHKKLSARSKFNEVCKVDFVNNNLAESFNSWIRKTKVLHLVDLLDRIRTMIMAKFELGQRISAQKFGGHIIIPAWIKKLNEKTRGLKMTLVKRKPFEAEVTIVDKVKRE